MNIGSTGSYPANKLSNFTAFSFVFDGVECASMEGLLQSFKFENIIAQSITCGLVGYGAKKKGRGRNKEWKSNQTLHWNGVKYIRKSKEYQLLLDRAYDCLYVQNEGFRIALKSAGKSMFTHSIGSSNRKETVLTENEFCSRLQYLKDVGLLSTKYETKISKYL